MTVPVPPERSAASSSLLRASIWVAIGALIAAAIVCVVWVFVGSQNGIIGRAFATIILLVAFAGAAILDAHLAPKRPAWFALASMAGWIVLLLIGAIMIWLPERYTFAGAGRFIQFLLIVLVVQLALLHLRLYVRASTRYPTMFVKIVSGVTIVLVVTLAVMLVLPLMVWEFVTFADVYWRVVVAVAILAAVGTTLIPLVNALFAPKKPRAAASAAAYAPHPVAPLPWPTFVDGITPLPVMPDGSPDWGAYYTGYPSPGAQVVGWPETTPNVGAPALAASDDTVMPTADPQPPAVPAATPAPAPPAATPAPAASAGPSGYEGYPPPPPLPPRD